jgi:hypothetical protein
MSHDDDSTRDLVLRALAASEIADSCTEPRLRAAFTDLAAEWLTRASEGAAACEAPSEAP